jgi:hypothetical protein
VLISWLHFSPICLTVKIPHDVGSWPAMDKPFRIHDKLGDAEAGEGWSYYYLLADGRLQDNKGHQLRPPCSAHDSWPSSLSYLAPLQKMRRYLSEFLSRAEFSPSVISRHSRNLSSRHDLYSATNSSPLPRREPIGKIYVTDCLTENQVFRFEPIIASRKANWEGFNNEPQIS